MAASLATPADLAGRLGRPVWAAGSLELTQVEMLLADASAHLRAVIGWQVSPPATVTTRVPPGGGIFRLPGAPVTAVTEITSGGKTIATSSYELVDGAIEFAGPRPIGATVTYSVGYATVPPELVSWTCVLASQALSAVADLGALGGGGVSTVAIDDFRKSWADGGDGAGFVLPARVEEKLRVRYGAGGVHVSGS